VTKVRKTQREPNEDDIAMEVHAAQSDAHMQREFYGKLERGDFSSIA